MFKYSNSLKFNTKDNRYLLWAKLPAERKTITVKIYIYCIAKLCTVYYLNYVQYCQLKLIDDKTN